MQSRLSKAKRKIKTNKFVPFVLLLASAIVAPYAVQAQDPDSKDLFIAFPKQPAKAWASSSFIIGSTKPGNALKVNDKPVKLNNDGFFAHVIPLKRGTNTFNIYKNNTQTPVKSLKVSRPKPRKPITKAQWKLECLEPKLSQGLTPGDLLILKARATPGGAVSVHLGNKVIHLSSASAVKAHKRRKRSKRKAPLPKANITRGQMTAYGKVFQKLPYNSSDLYVGFYKIQPSDKFRNLKPRFKLSKGNKVKNVISKAEVTVVRQPILAQTVKEGTVVRVAPGKARLTPLVKGVRLLVDGWKGKEFRCLYGKNKHVWIKAKEIVFENGAPYYSGPAPKSNIQTVNLNKSIYGDAIIIPLNQALPYEVFQSLNPNKLVLRIYGATADTDWVSQNYRKAFEGEGSNTSGMQKPPPGLVESIDWKQIQDDVYELNVNLVGNRQWGHSVSYANNNLVLHIKDPPRVASPGQSLSGLKVCVDPGHGGSQPGAMGCSGISEAQINLAISLKLKKLLEERGAKVIMTRVTDKTLGLYPRVDIAKAHNSDILLSVHNNSLPNGRDPWKEHGTSTYFYNKQAKELARHLNQSVVASLKFPNIGARYQNLALTRPTQMLAVLVEVGFMIHPDEYSMLLKEETQQKAAMAMVDGITNYLNKTK